MSLDLPLIALVDIAGRRRKILTYIGKKKTRAKLELLRLARLICRDPRATKLDMQRHQVK
jgi:hypothetical protein